MRLEKTLCLIFLAFLFTHCKKDSASTDDEVLKNQYEAMTILNQLSQLVEQHNNAGYVVGDALIRSMNDISLEPSVKEAYHLDSMYICITMHSGIKTRFSLMPLDSAGNSQFRGSGTGGGGVFKQISSAFSGTCTEITNKTVLVYHPYRELVCAAQLGADEDFERYKSEGVIDDYTIVLHEACNYDVVKTFKNYGLVIVSTHGYPDGFSFQPMVHQAELGDEFKPEEEMVALLQQTQDKQVTDQIRLGLIYIELRKAYTPSAGMQQNWENGFTAHWGLATSSPLIAQWDLSNTIVAGLHCYSGYESNIGLQPDVIPIAEAYREAGTRTYYGFQYLSGLSQPVVDETAQLAEWTLYENFFEAKDSTGIAHLDDFYDELFDVKIQVRWPDKPKNYFRLVNGSGGFCFKSCSEEFTDARDGETYKTVCIGEQTWMAENLRYAGSGICFNNDPSYCQNEGRLYSIFELINRQVSTDSTTVRGLCPQGWHVPSEAEYNELIAYCGGQNNAVIKLRVEDWPIGPTPTNEFGFDLKPGQTAYYSSGTQSIVFNTSSSAQAYLWTSSGTIRSTGSDSYKIFETRSTSVMGVIATGQTQGAEHYYHCRCVKD